MAFTPIPLCVESVLSAERSGEERKNIIHWKYTGAMPTLAELDQLNDEILTNIIIPQALLTCLGTNWNQIKSSEMSTAGGAVRTKAVNYNGTALGGVLPGNSSHCLTKRTSLRGARYRGRFYLFDLPESYFNGDDVENPFLPFITSLTNGIIGTRVGGKFTPAVASRVVPTVATIYNQMTFDLVADSQRRRLKKRGR